MYYALLDFRKRNRFILSFRIIYNKFFHAFIIRILIFLALKGLLLYHSNLILHEFRILNFIYHGLLLLRMLLLVLLLLILLLLLEVLWFLMQRGICSWRTYFVSRVVTLSSCLMAEIYKISNISTATLFVIILLRENLIRLFIGRWLLLHFILSIWRVTFDEFCAI